MKWQYQDQKHLKPLQKDVRQSICVWNLLSLLNVTTAATLSSLIAFVRSAVFTADAK